VSADFDTIPVRLPSGTKAFVQLPRPFTLEDGVHLMNFLSEYIEGAECADPAPVQQAHAGADEVERLMIEHRIAVLPEYEGGFEAKVYRDQEHVLADGYGSTPRAAIDAAIRAAQEGDEHENR
jgi:hypothetical protein